MNDVSEEKSTAINEYGPDGSEDKIHSLYLLSAANYLKEIPSKTLRCHWNILLADILQMKGIVRCFRDLEKLGLCEYCQTPWMDGDYHVKVMPKRKRKKKLRKLLRRVKNEKELSRVQKSLFNSLHFGPSVIVNCKICRKSSRFKIPENVENQMLSPTPKNDLQEYRNVTEAHAKKKKKKKKKKNENTPTVSVNDIIEIQDKNECNCKEVKMENIDDIIIVDENLKSNKKLNVIPIKRKLDEDDDDDDVHILPPESVILKKIKMDGFTENPIKIKPDNASGKQSRQWNTINDNYITLNTLKPKTKVNFFVKKSKQNQRKQKKKGKKKIVSTNHPQGGKKKNSLNRWKKLIAGQEEKAIKTSSLQDFLTAL